jgi:glycosyltransferase involved in cell wall biosynthesis
MELNLAKYSGKNKVKYVSSYLHFLLLSFIACTKLFIRNSVDIIYVHNMPNFLVFAAIVPLLFGKKVILDIHDTLIETYSTKFRSLSNKISMWSLYLEEYICCALACKIICVNDVQREALIKRCIPQRKIVISMNVPDPKRFCAEKKELGFREKKDGFRMVYYGTMAKMLGIDVAIKAVALLKDRIPGFEFHIIGSRGETEEFINLSERLGVERVIKFYREFFSLEDLFKIVDDMDLGIVPNRKNPATELMLPVKMLESIALGIPVVVPRLKAIEYYFGDDMVFYFEPDNVDSLARTIYEAYEDEVKRKAKAKNARGFLSKFGWQTHKYDLINLYKLLS